MTNNVQPSYSERMEVARVGMTYGCDFNADTGLVETVAGIGFGLAVSQGVGDKGILLGGQSEDFRGVTVRDVTLDHSVSNLDKYVENENAGVITRGKIWVAVSTAVAADAAVHYDATTGIFKASGGEVLAGARWVLSAAAGAGLALLELSGFQNSPAS